MDYEGIENWQINKAIANVLGLKIVKLDKPEVLDWFEPTIGKQVHIEQWFYIELFGKNISGTWDTEANAWEHALIPNYVENANEALNLLVDGWVLEVSTNTFKIFGKWVAQYYTDGIGNVAKGFADTPAEAICRARLALDMFLSENK